MAEQNAIHPVRRRDRQSRNEFFAEYERLILVRAGADVTAEQVHATTLSLMSKDPILAKYAEQA